MFIYLRVDVLIIRSTVEYLSSISRVVVICRCQIVSNRIVDFSISLTLLVVVGRRRLYCYFCFRCHQINKKYLLLLLLMSRLVSLLLSDELPFKSIFISCFICVIYVNVNGIFAGILTTAINICFFFFCPYFDISPIVFVARVSVIIICLLILVFVVVVYLLSNYFLISHLIYNIYNRFITFKYLYVYF